MNQAPSPDQKQPVDIARESVAGEEDPGAAIDATVAAPQAAPSHPAHANVCPRCGGTGHVPQGACPDCGGTGKLTVNPRRPATG